MHVKFRRISILWIVNFNRVRQDNCWYFYDKSTIHCVTTKFNIFNSLSIDNESLLYTFTIHLF